MEHRIINLINRLQALKLTSRTGWKMRDIENCESISDHSFRVAFTAMLLCDLLTGYDIDKEKLIRMSLLHDICEVETTDIPYCETKKMGRDKKYEIELAGLETILKVLPETLKRSYIELWNEFEDMTSIESKIVKFADKFEMLVQAYEYEKEGYKNLDEFWDNRENINTFGIKYFEDLLKTLYKLRKKS